MLTIPQSGCWGPTPCCRLIWPCWSCWDCWDLNPERCCTWRRLDHTDTGNEPRCCSGHSASMLVASPEISMALFLKVLMTVPSFLRRRGELRLSATFCFSRDRTFRLGSETGRVRRGQVQLSVAMATVSQKWSRK